MNAIRSQNTLLTTEITKSLSSDDLIVDQIGKTVARSLDHELDHLSAKTLHRLEKARENALSKQKIAKSPQKSNLVLFKDASLSWFGTFLLIAVTVFLIAQWQKVSRLRDIADVDAALLTDSVPPDAYADAGFRLYMKNMLKRAEQESNSAIESTLDSSSAPANEGSNSLEMNVDTSKAEVSTSDTRPSSPSVQSVNP